MRKVVIPRAGSEMQVEDHPDPQPQRGEVRVAVAAAGISYADSLITKGLYASARQAGYPITPGFEFSGVIDAVGDGVEESRIGQEVCGLTRFGAYASHLCLNARQAFPLPAGFGVVEAAAFPTNFITAWYALHDLCHLRRGFTVLIHSAAGGVGGALVQVAKCANCRVVGVVGGAAKVEVAREAGADVVIDRKQGDLWTQVREQQPNGFDAVFDANGYVTLMDSYSVLRPEGRLIIFGFRADEMRSSDSSRPGFDPVEMLNKNRGVLAFNLSFLFHEKLRMARTLKELWALAKSGGLKPPRVTAFPLDDVTEAHRAIESGTTVGKLVLTP